MSLLIVRKILVKKCRRSNDNVVRMMTIHSSKGLEFPFVIYSGLSKKFNKGDLNAPVILNQQYGLGMDYFDVNKDMAFPSLALWHIEQ